MITLNIETSTSCCSAAITQGKTILAHRAQLENANHASDLPVFVEELLSEARTNNWKIDAIALSEGPGSYTGLRIGASLAKGLCYGLNIPLIPIDTLQVLCASMKSQCEELVADAYLCPLIDARRMEVYTAKYEMTSLHIEGMVEAKIIDEHSYNEDLKVQTLYFFGNGSAKCKDVIVNERACFVDGINPDAKYMGELAEQVAELRLLDIKQVAYYEPYYLKEFVAAPSRVKGLNKE